MLFGFRVCRRGVGEAARALGTWSAPRAPLKVYDDGLKGVLQQQLQAIREAGTYKSERVIVTPQSSSIRVKESATPVINFCANNYLGLADHPALVQSAKEYLTTHGFGLSSVRFICGTQDIHKQLEQKIAQFHGFSDAILYASCFDANAGVFEGLLSEEDAIISDALNHASIIDGIRLSKAKRLRYQHLDMASLEENLKEAQSSRVRLIVTDGVFSMDGDIAPLREICDLADKYNALVMIDECHATGFIGNTGRGTIEACGVEGRIDIINTTLGKALGGATGGYTVARKEIVEILRQRSRPYLFSNSLAPCIVGASLKAYDLIAHDDYALLRQLKANTERFRSRMTQAGFTISGKNHPISPVMLGDARLASVMADDMLKRGIYVIGFSFPVVPRGQARIRVQLSAAHTLEQVDNCVDAFIEVGRKHGVVN